MEEWKPKRLLLTSELETSKKLSKLFNKIMKGGERRHLPEKDEKGPTGCYKINPLLVVHA